MRHINFHYLIRVILGKATCLKAKGARIGPAARILNILGNSRAIQIGANSVVLGELMTFAHGGRIEIGEWSFVGEGTRVWSAAEISIGNRVLISHNVNIMDNLTHPLEAAERHRHFRSIMTEGHPRDIKLGERPVRIEDDAWIAASSTVLGGVTIGRGAIVGAGAVVTHDVPPLTVVAGNPARVIRHLSEAQEQL